MSTQQNKELVRLATERGINNGELDFVDEVFAPDYVVHATGVDLPPGPDAFRAAVTLWRTAFPDFHMTIEDMIGEDDLVAVKFTTTGTHQGQLLHLSPTGRTFTVSGADMHRVRDGRVVESWISDDFPRILLELGALREAAPEEGAPA